MASLECSQSKVKGLKRERYAYKEDQNKNIKGSMYRCILDSHYVSELKLLL